jgi:hypothetical protein
LLVLGVVVKLDVLLDEELNLLLDFSFLVILKAVLNELSESLGLLIINDSGSEKSSSSFGKGKISFSSFLYD